MQPPNTRRVLVSVAEAAERLGISDTEVRRRIRRGTLEAEKTERPQGTLLRVIFNEPGDTPSPANQPPETRQDAPSASLREILEPLTEAHERLFEAYAMIAELRERVGRAEAGANHATSRADTLQSTLDHERDAHQALVSEAAASREALESRAADAEAQAAALTVRLAEQAAEIEAERRPFWKRWLGVQ